MPGVCTFNAAWLGDASYSNWLLRDKGRPDTMARCQTCLKSFDIANMGEAALKSHMRGKKHKELMDMRFGKQSQMTLVTVPVNVSTVSSVDDVNYSCATSDNGVSSAETATTSMTVSAKPVQGIVTRNKTLAAEIWWSLKVTSSHYSYNSAAGTNLLFQKMFPDSRIAAGFHCGDTKTAYLTKFGIAPHFKSLLAQKIEKADAFVLLFDESMNKNQTKQMDYHIRVWEHREVKTRYYGSDFLGHATADDMVASFEGCTAVLPLKNMLQLSMDGPNVN